MVKSGETDSLLWRLPWGHHALLLQKFKDVPIRPWYMAQAVAPGWSRRMLQMQIEKGDHGRQGALVNNFAARLPPPDVLQQEIIDHLEAALTAFRDVAAALPKSS